MWSYYWGLLGEILPLGPGVVLLLESCVVLLLELDVVVLLRLDGVLLPGLGMVSRLGLVGWGLNTETCKVWSYYRGSQGVVLLLDLG